jgi:hypothetical protein
LNINYLPGHSEQEIERLQLQALCLEGLTRRLIKECGIEPGMRVLEQRRRGRRDAGC